MHPNRNEPVPIACSLSATSLQNQLSEWQQVLSGIRTRVAIPGGVRLEFGDGIDLHELTRLAAAEQSCCRFFSFAITVDNRGVGLEVRAPSDAREIVHALFGAPS